MVRDSSIGCIKLSRLLVVKPGNPLLPQAAQRKECQLFKRKSSFLMPNERRKN